MGTFGSLGEGKTLLLAYIGRLHIEEGWDCYTNFGLKDSQPLASVMELRSIENCWIGLDDIVIELDSRQYGSNSLVTWLLQLARKKHLKIAYSAQVLSAVDLRLRHITNLIIMTNQVQYPKFKLRLFNKDGELLRKYRIKYSPDIAESYDTDKIVYQRINYSDLLDIYTQAKTMDLYKPYVQARYNMSATLAQATYKGLKAENPTFTKALLFLHGYVLEDRDGRAGVAAQPTHV